jgi:hypothetical protein
MSTSFFNQTNNGNGNGTHHGATVPLSLPAAAAEKSTPVKVLAVDAATAPVGSSMHHAGDLISRLRDKWGNRLPWFYSYNIPTIDGERLEDTPLAEALPHLIARFPVRSHQVHHFYNHQLLTAYRYLVALRAEEERKLLLLCEQGEQTNTALDTEFDRKTEEDRESLPGLELALQEAHLDAAAKVSRVGGGYDPENPTDHCVLRLFIPSPEAVAAQLQLPWTGSDASAKVSSWLSWMTTCIVGAMIGVSLGIMSHTLIASDLDARPGALMGFVAGGIGAAVLGKYALFLSAREASQRYWLGRSAAQWVSFTVVAALVAVGVLIMDSTVEQHGLMAGIRMQQMAEALDSTGGSQRSEGGVLYFMAALILTWGYVTTHLWQGYLHGRFDACRNLIQKEQAKQAQDWEEAARQNDGVRDALEMLARVRDLIRQEKKILTRITNVKADVDARRVTLLSDLPDDGKRRLQDARDNFEGAQADFNGEWATLRDACEPLGGFWWRVGQWFATLGRPDRRRTRNGKRAL